MNKALVFLRERIRQDEVIAELNPCLVVKSNKPTFQLRLAEAGLILDEKIAEGLRLDVICVVNENNLRIYDLEKFSKDDYLERFYYTTDQLHSSSFFCKPGAFSTISSLYKINFDNYNFKNTGHDTIELLTEQIFFLVNRLGFEVKIG